MIDNKVGKFWIDLFETYFKAKKLSLLEIGCGQGEFGLVLGTHVVDEYYGIDPDEASIKYAQSKVGNAQNIVYKIGKAEEIPFERKFDIIFYSFSWHFIQNFTAAINEASRVLAKDGIVVVLEPNPDTKNWKSPTLIKGNSEFSEVKYQRKMKALEIGKSALLSQKEFKIVEERKGDENRPNLWILKRKF